MKAERTLKNCLSIRRSDRVLVLCDSDTLEIAQIFFRAAEGLCQTPLLMEMRAGSHHGDEPPNIVADAMIHSDVIVAPTTHSITYTNATKAALARGARMATMPGMTMNMLEKGGLGADYRKISKNIRKFGRKFQRAKEIKVTSEEGTDMTMSIEGRKWVLEDNGVCHRRGSITNLPAGKVFIAPMEKTAQGHIVFDGAFIGAAGKKVEMDIKNGVAENIKGPDEVLEQLDMGRCSRTLCELGIGMNPRSNIIGNILEDQKALGTVHFGFGDNSTFGGEIECDIHNDGMLLKPSLFINERTVIENGKFVLKL